MAFLLEFKYFGLKNGNECHCGKSASRILPAQTSTCNYQCTGNKTQICGGHWRINIYQNYRKSQTGTELNTNQILSTNYKTGFSTTEASTLKNEKTDNSTG